MQPAGQQNVFVCFHMQPGMSGPGYSLLGPGDPLQVTAKLGAPQLEGGPHVEQSFPFGVQACDFGWVGVLTLGQLAVHVLHDPDWQVLSPLQLPHTPPQPFEPHDLPPQLGVHTG